jgi:small subunit ribosomal protein S6
MKNYEIMIITDIALGEDGAQSLSNQVKDLINSYRGKVLDSDAWGKRKFAYEMKKQVEGYYEVITFEMDPANMPKFKQKLNLINGLVRYLVTATK